jgi:hypothetical protein
VENLTDGVIYLRSLRYEDATQQLDGEEKEMVKWFSRIGNYVYKSGFDITIITLESTIQLTTCSH